MSTFLKIKNFDNLELLESNTSTHEYPLHYHSTFCVSLVRKGMLTENNVIGVNGSFIVSHPFEVHQNKLVGQTAYSMTTFYVGAEVLSSIGKTKYISFPKSIDDPALFAAFYKLSEHLLSNQDINMFNTRFADVLGDLVVRYSSHHPYVEAVQCSRLEEVKLYIASNLYDTIQLEMLGRISGMDKFKFIRSFKKYTGLTPYTFILLNRIEQGKKMIAQGKPIVHTALDTGFFDQSHFSNCFKFFTGLTPRQYQKGCNIFQDVTSHGA